MEVLAEGSDDMTKAEAIQVLKECCDARVLDAEEKQALNMAIESLQTDIVRCKDCMHRVHDKDRQFYYCEKFYGQGDVSDENFCQWGERREPCA